jgi:hypothetical protein
MLAARVFAQRVELRGVLQPGLIQHALFSRRDAERFVTDQYA